jgi:predicted outer membrane protein
MRTYLLCIALLASCGDDDNNNNGNNNNRDADEQRASDDGDMRGNALATQARGEFSGTSDPDAIAKAAAVVTTINTGEIAQASFVLSINTDSNVRALASEIQTDHQANDAMLHALLQARGISPADNAVSLALRDEAMKSLDQLKADAPPDLAMDYTEMQVMMHQEAFVLVGALQDYVQDGDFRQFLSDTQDTIEQHRKDAGRVLHGL